jgi:hypothetical protein
VYDIFNCKDTFTKMTREITKYIGHEFNDAGEFHTGMVYLALCPLDEPTPPTNPNQVVEFELWNMACRNYEKQAKRMMPKLIEGICSYH